MKDIKDLLMQEAREQGICVDGYNDMRGFNHDELVDYYIKNPDWCLERSFPSLGLLRDNFEDQQHKGIFIDTTFANDKLKDNLVYVFHNCKGAITTGLNLEKAIIPMLYFANDCDMHIHCESPTRIKIPLYIFGHNNITTSGNAEFLIYRHELIGKGGER